MPDPNRRYGSFAQTGGGRWTAAFAHLLPARPERDLVVELRRHAVVATCLLTYCMLFGGARVRHHPRSWPLCLCRVGGAVAAPTPHRPGRADLPSRPGAVHPEPLTDP